MSIVYGCAYCSRQFTISRWEPGIHATCPHCTGLQQVIAPPRKKDLNVGSVTMAAGWTFCLLMISQVALAIWWAHSQPARSKPREVAQVVAAAESAVTESAPTTQSSVPPPPTETASTDPA